MGAALRIENARIWTGDSARPWARVLRIDEGRVAELDGDVRAAPGDTVLDAEGRAVVPGLIDAHVHLLIGGLAMDRLDLSAVTGRETFEQAIAARHADLPAGCWLVASGWSSDSWPAGAVPDKTWLSAAGPRPAICYRTDLHAAVVNEAVLDRCDTAEDPPGGRFVRDPGTGEPTGLVLESALWHHVDPLVPRPDVAARQDALLAAQAHCHRAGLTTVGTMEYARDVEEVYRPLGDRLTLRCRVILLDRPWPMDVEYGRCFGGDEQLDVIGYKSFLDGTFGSRTARMLEPYADDPANRGLLVELAAAGHLQAWARTVAAAGLSPVMHAIGDEAARLALDAAHAVPPAARPRIEHAQQVAPVDLPRFAGVIASMQPRHMADDGRHAQRCLGQQRLAGSFAFRTLARLGARLAFGSDWPVVTCDPMEGIAAAVTGRCTDGSLFRPEENLTVEQALAAYTAGAAHAVRLDEAGVLRPGGPGDLVMLDLDPFSADWADRRPRAVLTVVAGRVVYDGRHER